MTEWSSSLRATITDRPQDADAFDVRSFLGNIENPGWSSPAAPQERTDSADAVELLETDPVQVAANPLSVDAVIDGIQSSVVVTWQDSRPIVLSYVAAGAAIFGPDLGGLMERITVVASQADEEWLSQVNTQSPPLPTHLLAETSPPDVERVSLAWVRNTRDHLERELTRRLLDAGAERLLLDGDLLARAQDPRLVSVVKTLRTRFLADETVLWTLEEGWRSPMFRMPAAQGATLDRYSCYLRIHPHRHRAWNHGLIRLESYDPELLDPLAALAIAERQPAGSPDPRWDRHLSSVRVCEQLLRDRRPAFF